MSFVGFRAQSHPGQTKNRGARDSVDDRATPPDLFEQLDRRHGPFTVDVAAAEHNTKCERFYSRSDNGLERDWSGERVWCNPPYSDIEVWVEKAWAETGARVILMLLPSNRTEQGWWQRLVEPYRDRAGSPLRCEFLAGRPRFIAPGDDRSRPGQRPPFGVVVLVWQWSQPALVRSSQIGMEEIA